MKKVANSVLFLLFGVFIGMVFPGCNSSVKESDDQIKEKKIEEVEGESLYQTAGRWDDQYGDTITLSKLKGKIPVVSMVFTRCSYACPRIVADLRAIERLIPEDKKDQVVFVLVSFDSDRDHTKELKEFAKEMKLGKNWLILHGNEEDVRELSMLLDVKYKKLPNGDFTHSSGVTLLNTKGAIAVQSDGLKADPNTVIEKIKRL